MRRGLMLCLALFGCGARTGLPSPDDLATTPDAAFDAPSDAPYPCVPGKLPLVRGQAELLLVIDRSTSMQEDLEGTHVGPRKWDDLHDALAATLPEFEDRIQLGGVAYPRRFDGTTTRTCDVPTKIDVEPGPHRANDVLAIFTGSDPSGGTPTAAALTLAGDLLTKRLARTRTEAIVLATDGGPNCNVELDPKTCTCVTSSSGCVQPTQCIDDVRTVSVIANLAAKGIPTFVVGLDTTAANPERAALEAMAKAGGRPRSTGTPYYSVRDPDAVTEAFRSVQRSVTECRLFMTSRPDDPSRVDVQIDGASVPRDPSHVDGWDWASVDFGQIDFFGPACDRARGAKEVIANVPTCG